jgi:aerotaxis receptor
MDKSLQNCGNLVCLHQALHDRDRPDLRVANPSTAPKGNGVLMRSNLPITRRAFPFPLGETLVSTTDLKGRILYGNPAFFEVSGFAREEMLGQPHNMIRHPDMPEEAFRDMWATIAQGQPWSGMVKNRRKNGDHYWVLANVTPLTDAQSQVTGYMSVRTEPSRDAVQAAEVLYAKMREEAGSARRSLVLHRGQLLRQGWTGRLQRLARLGLHGTLSLACGVAALTGWAAAYASTAGWTRPSAAVMGIGLMAAAVVAAIGGGVLRSLTLSPLEALVRYTHQLAGGNLTQQLATTGRDEIGHLAQGLAQLNVNLMSIVRDSRNGVTQMRLGTQVIAEGNQDLSARTESQASSLEETAASMEQITATIRQSTDMAAQAASRADSARSVTEHSGELVNALSGTMSSISEASRKISDIIQVVDSIAFQTNILALNAAVEAARAGEQGRGFAVVAGEVRALAQRTTVAAREVRGLIQASVEQVDEGGKQTERARGAMQEAQQAVNDVHDFIQQISQGMREQMQGVAQVNQAVTELDTVTQQNAALVEEIAASASDLSQKSGEVADAVAVFRLAGDQQAAPNAVALRKAGKAAPDKKPAAAAPPAVKRVATPPAPRSTAVKAAPRPLAVAASATADSEGWDSF